MPQPPEHENKMLTWPDWPLKLRISSSHEEGVTREFAVLTQKFTGENGQVKKLHCTHVDAQFKPVPGTEFEIEADLVLLAMGFVHPVHEGMLKALGVALDQRGNVSADTDGLPDTRCPRCSPPATCGAASHWWCGRSAKAARRRTRSTSS